MSYRIAMCLTLLVLGGAAATHAEDVPLRMNQMQVIGTHNSYHQRPSADKLALMSSFTKEAKEWNYDHKPLTEQLSNGVRSFELDLHAYPDGWEIFHVPTLDEGTSCRRFVDCLEQVKGWSEQHPNHVPISFLMEIKEEERVLSVREMLPLTTETLLRIDAEIRSVFPENRLITPDQVRGDAPTLAEAVRTTGWPTLEAARGHVYFILHERGELRDLYTAGAPSLEGRAMFVNSSPDRPDAACTVLDNANDPAIPEVVKAGMIVRTRVDHNMPEDPAGSAKRLAAGLASGAQILSTDYPPGEADPASGYFAQLPGGVAAIANRVNAPASASAALE